ncbi:MAG: MFS transporter [Dehalococcoidia bacterium]
MFRVLRRRDFGLLFAGQLVSQIGDYALLVALPVWTYQLTGSAAATGGVFIAATLPQLVLSPVAGVFVDRWPRRATMIGADLLRAALVLGLFAVRSPDQLWLIYALTCLQSSVSRFFFPARTAVLPLLVPREQLMQANAAVSFSDALARLGGPALGGLFMAAWGVRAAIALDALSYVASAALIAMLHLAEARGASVRPGGWGQAIHAFSRDLAAGVRTVAARSALRMLFGTAALFSLAQGIISVLIVVLVTAVWGGGPAEVGWLTSAQGLGALAGGMAVGVVAARVGPRTLLTAGSAGTGCLLLLMVNQPSTVVALVLYALVGVLAVGLQVGVGTLLQLETTNEFRGRVSSLLSTVGAAAALGSMGVTSAVAAAVGTVAMLDIAGLLFIAAGLVTFGLGKVALPRPERLKSRLGPVRH